MSANNIGLYELAGLSFNYLQISSNTHLTHYVNVSVLINFSQKTSVLHLLS